MRRLAIFALAGAAMALAGCSIAASGASPANTNTDSATASPTVSSSPSPSVKPTATSSPTPPPTKPIGISYVTPYTGSEFGIAQPLVIKFTRSIPRDHRAEVEKALQIGESLPDGVGAWHWTWADEVRFRPYRFWPAKSTVTLDTTAYNNLNLGYGYYGKGIGTVHWTVGRSLVIYIDGYTDYARVFENGKLVRTMGVSLGKPGWESRSGIKVIQEKYKVKLMTGKSIGAETNYSLLAPYAVRITSSGEFLHGAPWAYYRIGKYNGSHGCTNLFVPDALWVYNNTMPGDPVIFSNTGRPMETWNTYGDWDMSWKTWLSTSSAGDVQIGPAATAPDGMVVPAYTLGKLPPQPSPTPPPNYNTQTPTPTPSVTKSPSPKPTRSKSPTPSPKPTPTHSKSPTPKPTPTKSPTPTPTATPTSSPSA